MSHDVTYMGNLKKNDTKELIYKINSQTERNEFMVTRAGVGEGQLGSLGLTCTHCYI